MAEDQNKNGSQKGGLTKDKDVLDPTKSGDKKSKGIGESAQDLRKKVDGAKKAGGVAKAVIGFLTSNPAGWVILGIIVLIIVIVGFYYFFTTIPGLAMAKLKAMIQDGIDLVQSWFTTEADAYINEEDIVKLANYLEELEYDLVGYGFIVPTSSTTSEYPTYDELIAAGYSYGITEYDSDGDGTEESAYRYYMDDESKIYDGVNYYITDDDGSIVSDTSYYYNSIGVLIDNTTGSVVADDTYTDKYALVRSTEELATSGQGVITDMGEADTTLLRTYLLSDYRIYAIRNNDDNLMNKVYSRIKKTFGGYSSAWSKGLLKFYYATDGLAEKEWSEDLLATLTGGSIDFGDAISISSDGKTLSLKKGNFNNAMQFSIDGWADRYGMSLEFLLSLHLATGAPELVYAMLQSFDIEVQVYLNDSGDAEVTGGYVDLVDADATFEEDFISWDTVVDVVTQAHEDGIINDFQYSTIAGDDDIVGWDSLSLTKKFCQYLLKNLNLTSPDNCLGAAQWETIVKATLDDEWIDSNDLLSYSITDEDLNDAIDEYTNYSYLDDDGGDHDFTIGHLTNSIGTDDTSYLEETYTYFPNTAANNGYSEDNAEIADIETEEFETKVYSDGDASAGTWMEYTIYTTTRVKQLRTWTAVVTNEDGTTEEVDFEWVTYKYLVYKTGTYKTFNDSDPVTTTLDEPVWVDTIIVEWISRDKTDYELIQAGILDEDGNITGDFDVCSSQDWESYKKCCKNCQKYIKKLLKAIANTTDSNYAYYTPYIARVLGSWFRDTYFVIPETADKAIEDYINEADRNEVEMSMIENSYGTDGEYVVVDEEYLAETGEYWTSYEMVQDENGNDTDEYQLYYLNPNGITSEYTLEEFLEDPYTCLEDYKEGYASKVGVASEDTYSSQEEAEEAGHAFVKKTKVNTYLGLSSSSLEKVVWSAYGFGEGGESGWTKVTNYESNDYMVAVYEQIESGGGQVNNTEDGGFYYNVSSTASVTQTEDAQRSQTNPTVKWLFKYRKYYIYDGSTDTALAIAEDKEAVLEAVQSYLQQKYVAAKYVAVMLGTYGRSANRQAYLSFTESNVTTLANIALSVATGGVSGVVLELAEGVSYNWDDVTEQWLEWQLDMYYSGDTGDYEGVLIDEIKWSDYGLDEERDYGDPRDPDLIATVNITKNSLNAFSILENTETYAAEYAYRDFKELIVELDYFDKEDLSDAISSVFTWVLPDLTATGWPNRPWDKQSNDYGALIESATTYDYLEEVDYDPSTMSAIESTAEDDEEEGTTDTDTSVDTETDDTTTDSNGSQTILDKAQEILDVMDSENWSYQSGCWSGRTTWEDAQDGSKVSSCATYVSWVLQEAGYLESGKALSHGDEGSSTESVYESYADNLTDATWYYPECTTKDYDLVPGDIVIVERSGSWRTIAIYAGKDSSGNNTFYGAINDNMLDAEYDANGPVVWDNELNNETLKIVVRFPGDSTSTSTTFEGYSGGEAVVSPVTGKVLSYGTHERTNVYTGDTEIVGFITIEAMSTEEQLSSSDVSVNSAEGEGKEITNDEIATAYGYFADEYEDTCQGYVITIDGINVDLNMTVDDAYGAYEKNEVAKLYNKDTQADREAEEDLKYDAPFFINVGGTETIEGLPKVSDYSQENVVYTCSDDCTYYIKEGKYIGTTMTDDEATERIVEEGSTIAQTVTYGEEDGDVTTSEFTYDGPANYMRIIMKDTNYSIVDDVEDYFDIPDPEDDTSSGTLFTDLSEEILYWILVDCEGTCDWDDSAGTSGTTDLGDGTISTSLGVTNHCESIAESLGYGSYWPMSLGDRIPNDVVSDVAIAFLDSTLDTLQSKYPDRTFTETQMAALMSIYYNFGHVPSAIDSLLSSSASDQEIYEVWSTIRDTATSAGYATYPGWAKRDTAEANMWLTGEWYECYSGVKIRFISETPYSDFLSNSSAQVYESAE